MKSNRREDGYGGSTENRTRILSEIYHRARKQVDADFPILAKINTTDFLPGGIDIEEAIRVAKILHATGCGAIPASTLFSSFCDINFFHCLCFSIACA